MKLEEKLLSLRKEKGLTQMQVAEELDVSRQAVSRWEAGTAIPSTENLRVLGKLYGVPIDYLLSEDSEASLEGTKSKKKRRLGQKTKKLLLLFVFVLAFAVIVAVLVYRAGNGKQTEDISVGAMDSETWDDTGSEDFSMDW